LPELLSRPPEEGARLLALRHLEAALAARQRLADPEDVEALHDLRVALRRLRSTLRSYRPYLAGSLSKKLARRLRDLAAATGPGRDAEVQVAWLRGAIPALTRAERVGAAWLLARISRRMDEGYEDAHHDLGEKLPKLAETLRSRLSVYSTEVHLDAETPRQDFAAVTGEALQGQIEELRDQLAAIAGPDDQDACHEARITAKRIRYLLEPLVEEMPDTASIVKRFKGLQDLLGDLHDAHVLEIEIGEALEAAAAERARLVLTATLDASAADDVEGEPSLARRRAARRPTREPGLLALALRNRERRNALFTALDSRFLHGKAARFLRQLDTLAKRLRDAAANDSTPPPGEPES